jgi:hypothetical protein
MGGIIQTNRGYRNNALPRLTGENPDLMPGSPLAVIGLWVEALRFRFNATPAEPLPWVWMENLRPADDEAGTPLLPDPADPHLTIGSPRRLLIESAYNIEKAARNYRPALYVERGDVRPIKLSINNFAGEYLPTQIKAYHCMAGMPITIECVSEASGESSTIGDTVWAFILSCREIFRKDFGFHEITEPIMGKTEISTEDKPVWVTPVQFEVQYDVRWSVRPIEPFLRDLTAKITQSVGGQDYLTEVAARDLYPSTE